MLQQLLTRTNTTILSEHCTVPGHEKWELMKLPSGQVVCPFCERERKNRELEEKNADIFKRLELKKKYAYLKTKSVLSDATLTNAGFKNFVAKEQEEVMNKRQMLHIVKRYEAKETFNTWLMGDPGVGKSHLSMATLKNLNELNGNGSTCLFISISAMLRKIRASFSNKESIYTEDYFVNLMGEADYLVLDDIGSETGGIGTDKAASDFTQKIIYAVMDMRQNKSTIFTTNLSWDDLNKMYDKKLISRMSRNIETVIFKKTSDKRLGV